MVLYYGRHYTSATLGRKLVNVTCDKCGREYHYELARVGSGKASAPYTLGQKGAEERAASGSRRDLDRRLLDEAEIVPCPSCRWVNEALVLGFRRGRYRRWTSTAAGFAVLGTVTSLLIAWFLSNGPAVDRSAMWFFLVFGPILAIGSGLSLLGLRALLRGRIDPNRSYPNGSPVVPPGSPPPLVANPTTGELEPVVAPGETAGAGGVWVDHQVGRSELPRVCCDCAGTPEPRSTYSRPLQPPITLEFPLCSVCSRRWSRAHWVGALVALGIVAALCLPILWLLQVDEVVFWLALGAMAITSPIVGSMIAGARVAPLRVRVVDQARGVARLWFRNPRVLDGLLLHQAPEGRQ